MPFVRIDWFPGSTVEQQHERVATLTPEIARMAKCRTGTIKFIFTEVTREDWTRNGQLFVDHYEYENEPEQTKERSCFPTRSPTTSESRVLHPADVRDGRTRWN